MCHIARCKLREEQVRPFECHPSQCQTQRQRLISTEQPGENMRETPCKAETKRCLGDVKRGIFRSKPVSADQSETSIATLKRWAQSQQLMQKLNPCKFADKTLPYARHETLSFSVCSVRNQLPHLGALVVKVKQSPLQLLPSKYKKYTDNHPKPQPKLGGTLDGQDMAELRW